MVSLYKVGRYVVLSILSIFWICIFLLKAKWLFNLFLDVFFFFFKYTFNSSSSRGVHRAVFFVPDSAQGILTLPAHSQKNFYLTCPFPKKFWPILLIINQRNTVWSHTHSKRNCDWSCPLHKEFWTIPPTLKIIINDLAPSIINSDQSYPLQCHAAQAIPLCLFLMHTSSHECFINRITLCTFQDLLERPLIG